MSYEDLLVMRPGVTFSEQGEAKVLVWAPKAEKVQMQFGEEGKALDLEQRDYGFWTLQTRALWPGDRYGFLLDGEGPFPDPATLY